MLKYGQIIEAAEAAVKNLIETYPYAEALSQSTDTVSAEEIMYYEYAQDRVVPNYRVAEIYLSRSRADFYAYFDLFYGYEIEEAFEYVLKEHNDWPSCRHVQEIIMYLALSEMVN